MYFSQGNDLNNNNNKKPSIISRQLWVVNRTIYPESFRSTGRVYKIGRQTHFLQPTQKISGILHTPTHEIISSPILDLAVGKAAMPDVPRSDLICRFHSNGSAFLSKSWFVKKGFGSLPKTPSHQLIDSEGLASNQPSFRFEGWFDSVAFQLNIQIRIFSQLRKTRWRWDALLGTAILSSAKFSNEVELILIL